MLFKSYPEGREQWYTLAIPATATWETEIRGSQFRDRPSRKKVSEILSQKTSWVWWYSSVIPGILVAEVEGLWSEASLSNIRAHLKNN
jgi:hypothetical protein